MMRWAILSNMIEKRKWKTGAELGVWKGKTYKYILMNCPEVVLIGVDLYQPQPDNTGPETWVAGENGHEWDHEKYYNDILMFQKEIGPRAKFIKATTEEASLHVEDYSLDFVFIDADHSYDGVKKDIELWDKKVKTGGCVMGHDIDWPDVRKAVEEKYNNINIFEDNVWCVNK